MKEESYHFGWKTWLIWVLVSSMGFVVGIFLSLLLSNFIGEILSSLLFGITIGIVQWLFLRRFIRLSGWWVAAGALAAPIGFAAVTAVQTIVGGFILKNALAFALLGFIVGAAQWLLLRGHFHKAGWWVPVNAIGWLLGMFAGWGLVLGADVLLGLSLDLADIAYVVLYFLLIGFFANMLTGFLLFFLMKQTKPLQRSKENFIGRFALIGGAVVLIVAAVWMERATHDYDALESVPAFVSMPVCDDLPSPICEGDSAYCSELVQFEPATGFGYMDTPLNGETWDNQYRSYLRRDLMMLVKYAMARVACETEDWDRTEVISLGLGDMSEWDGSIPGTSKGNPGHPAGTHEDGLDIDIAYYQRDVRQGWGLLKKRPNHSEGSPLRIMCKHTRFGVDVFHCSEKPVVLDPWRTALFLSYVSEHPHLRVIGVDGQIGLLLDPALEQLGQAGWISPEKRSQIPLVYETNNEGWGWYRHHHHHLHISMNPE